MLVHGILRVNHPVDVFVLKRINLTIDCYGCWVVSTMYARNTYSDVWYEARLELLLIYVCSTIK
jgi:hypothetical protein